MPPGVPHQPLAAKLWLSRRSSHGNTDSHGRPMSIESLEHVVRNRVRTFLRHTVLVTIFGTLLLGGCVWAAVYYSTKATVMRVAAGPDGSANAKIVQVLKKTVAQSHDRISLQLVPTDGPSASSQALADGKADLAIVPTTVGKSPDWPVVAILRQNVIALIVPTPPPPPPAATAAPTPTAAPAATPSAPPAAPAKKPEAAKPTKPAAKPATPAKTTEKTADKSTKNKSTKTKTTKTAKAKDTDDDDSDDDDDSTNTKDTKDKDQDANKLKVTQLAGKRVGIVSGNEATADLLNVVLKHYGVPIDKVLVSQIDPQNIADAVHKNAVDVIFVADSAIGQSIGDAVAAATQNGVPPTFIEIDQADGIAKRLAAFDSVEIDAGTFGGNPPMPEDKLTSLSFPEYLVARKTFNHNAIAELSKIIYTSRMTIAAQMAGEVKIEAPSTDKDADALVHQGTLDYLNDDQKTFFDKYGDDIFYGMLIFPVFGSAIAGFAGYLRADSRTRRLRHLQRVLDLVRKAHAAQTLEAIEHLQIEADHLVIAIIHLSEHEEFDESIRMSFSFALDQLRFAIAARRTAILDHGGAPPSQGAAPGSDDEAAAA
jgi:TRAP-type uncharacterized transport system substrate-binding protein